jgi:hypothetical protein
MAFRNVQVPAAAETANRNPIVDSRNKSNDNAVHSFIQAIASLAGCAGAFSARLDRCPTGVLASRAQFLDRARPPFEARHDLDIVLEMPPELTVVGSNSNPLLHSTSSTSRTIAAPMQCGAVTSTATKWEMGGINEDRI